MATLYIEQYANIVEDTGGRDVPVPGQPIGTNPVQKITIGASSARNSVDFDEKTRFLIITADADCQFKVGDSSVTADADSRLIHSGTYREVNVNGKDTRIAVIEKQ